jgi:hypothetical protein
MFKSKIITMAVVAVFTALPLLALAGVPDVYECEVSIAYSGPGTPSMMNVPNGNGFAFTEARDEEGNVVDATITLYIRDSQGVPIMNYPAEDTWLDTEDNGLVTCTSGSVSDLNTDFDGMTQWVNPLFAGGYSQAPVRVLINGVELPTTLDLDFNSPDINGDLVVNLADVALFTGCYFNAYCYAADYDNNGALNLSDLSYFAEHIGATCP